MSIKLMECEVMGLVHWLLVRYSTKVRVGINSVPDHRRMEV